jgi:uncharacterized SAM-binding protein YcdF (DUF218 family)
MAWQQRFVGFPGSILIVLAALGFSLVVVTVSPLVYWWATTLAGVWNDPSGEVLIVLGGSILDDGTIGQSSYWRCVYAARSYQEGKFREVVLSGGGKPIPVVVPMREFLECRGIPGGVIRLETASTSTRESALYTKQLLHGVTGRKVLLTSDYHMFRASRAFKKVGLEVLPRPFPDARKRAASWQGRWPAFLDLMTESAKIVYYFLRGWI